MERVLGVDARLDRVALEVQVVLGERQLLPAGDLELVEVDISADDALLRRYLERIPVLELDGLVISELVPEASSLEAALLHTSAR